MKHPGVKLKTEQEFYLKSLESVIIPQMSDSQKQEAILWLASLVMQQQNAIAREFARQHGFVIEED